jgi:hypothetical protein
MNIKPATQDLELYVETGESYRVTMFGLNGTYKQYQWFDLSLHMDVIAVNYSTKYDHFQLCEHFVLVRNNKDN